MLFEIVHKSLYCWNKCQTYLCVSECLAGSSISLGFAAPSHSTSMVPVGWVRSSVSSSSPCQVPYRPRCGTRTGLVVSVFLDFRPHTGRARENKRISSSLNNWSFHLSERNRLTLKDPESRKKWGPANIRGFPILYFKVSLIRLGFSFKN